MPEATERDTPKGQGYGEAQQTQELDLASAAAVSQPLTPAIPAPYSPGEEPDEGPDEEVGGPNVVSLEDGDINLDEILMGASRRPDEDVRMGLPGVSVAQRPSEILQGLVSRGFSSSDVMALLKVAQGLDL